MEVGRIFQVRQISHDTGRCTDISSRQNRLLNYYFYLKLASYKQQQPFLVDKLTSRSSALAANVDEKSCSG